MKKEDRTYSKKKDSNNPSLPDNKMYWTHSKKCRSVLILTSLLLRSQFVVLLLASNTSSLSSSTRCSKSQFCIKSLEM